MVRGLGIVSGFIVPSIGEALQFRQEGTEV
jgi:hypothetical protein